MLGYLFAGLIVGPYIPIPVFADPERVEALAEFGVVLVMFAVGLEFRIAKLLRVLPATGLTGLVQVSFLIWAGSSVGRLLGWSAVASVFLGASIAISSTMVVSKVFEQRPVSADVREYVLGILVVQDVVAIALIAAMTAIAAGGGLDARSLAITVVKLAAVLGGMIVAGLFLVPRLIRTVVEMKHPEVLAVVAVGLCFGVAELAEQLGYSVALGAFIAGILVAESGKSQDVEHLLQPVRDIFAAVFFVSIGMTVDPRQAFVHLPLALVVFGVVIVAQLVSVSVVSMLSGHGLRRSISAGMSLGQIGEFSFIITAIGTGAGVVEPSLQPVIVTVAVLTAFTTPIMVGWSERAVIQADRRIPRRLRRLIGLYERWLERLVGEIRGRVATRPLLRALRAIVFDATGVVALVVSLALWGPQLVAFLAPRLDLEPTVAIVGAVGATVLLCVPLLVGLVRNTVALSRLVSEALVVTATSPVTTTVRSIALLAVVLAVGAPLAAFLRPLFDADWGIIPLVVLVAGTATYLWRTAGRLDAQYRSGAEHVAELLAGQTREVEDESPLNETEILPGLDQVDTIQLRPGDAAVGRTLADLDLRARTGATVLAIHGEHGRAVLPSGKDVLSAGDVLAVSGTETAVTLARSVIACGELEAPAVEE